MNTLTKSLIGVGIAGSIGGGGGYAIYQQLSTKSIGKQLELEGYEILSKDNEEWGRILASYEATIGTNNNLKFDGLKDGQDKLNSFKNKCENTLNKTYDNKGDYEKAAKWCTVPRSMKNMLKKDGFETLNAKDDEDSAHSKAWNDKIEAYNSSNEKQDKKFENIGGSSSSLSTDQNGRNALRAACRTLESKKHNEKDFEKELEKAKLWCAVKIKK